MAEGFAMLQDRTFEGTEAEHGAVEKLLGELADAFNGDAVAASVTRSEPGESGPLRVDATLPDGSYAVWLIHNDGTAEEATT